MSVSPSSNPTSPLERKTEPVIPINNSKKHDSRENILKLAPDTLNSESAQLMGHQKRSAAQIENLSFEELQKVVEDIAAGVEKATQLDQSESHTVSIQKYIEKSGSGIISKLLEEINNDPTSLVTHPVSALNDSQATTNAFLSSLAFVAKEISDTFEFLRIERNEPFYAADSLHVFKGIEIGSVLLKLLGAGGSVIVIQALIKQAQKEIEIKRAQLIHCSEGVAKEKLENDIHILETWVKLHHRTLIDHIKETVIATVFAFPRIGAGIFLIFEKASTTAGTIFSGVGYVVGFIGSIRDWYITEKNISKTKAWSQSLRNEKLSGEQILERQKTIFNKRAKENLPLLQDKLQELIPEIKIQGPNKVLEKMQNLGITLAPEINLENISTFKELSELLPSIQNELNEQLVRKNLTFKEVFDPLLKSLHEIGTDSINDQQQIIRIMLEDIRSKYHLNKYQLNFTFHVNLSEKNSEELTMLLASPTIVSALNNSMVQKSEPLSGSLRNAFKVFLIKKASIERGFLKMARFKAQIMAAGIIIMAALWIAVKASVIGGAVTGLVASGYGLLALAVVLLIAGLAYFYYKKPNVFVTMCKGVYVELVLRKIPLAIQRYRRQSALIDILTLVERAEAVRDKLFVLKEHLDKYDHSNIPLGLKKYIQKIKGPTHEITSDDIQAYKNHLDEKLKNYKAKMDEMTLHIEKLNKSVEEQEKKVHVLQDKIIKAAKDDLEHQLGLKKKSQKPQKEDVQEAQNEDVKLHKGPDSFKILAEALLSDEGLLKDPEIMPLLNLMEIDLKALRVDSSIEETERAIGLFFEKDAQELVNAIRTYNRIVKLSSA